MATQLQCIIGFASESLTTRALVGAKSSWHHAGYIQGGACRRPPWAYMHTPPWACKLGIIQLRCSTVTHQTTSSQAQAQTHQTSAAMQHYLRQQA